MGISGKVRRDLNSLSCKTNVNKSFNIQSELTALYVHDTYSNYMTLNLKLQARFLSNKIYMFKQNSIEKSQRNCTYMNITLNIGL